MAYRRALISLGSKFKAASETSLSSVPLARFLSLFSSLRYIFIICFSCSEWMVTWHPNAGLVTSEPTIRLTSGGHMKDEKVSKTVTKLQFWYLIGEISQALSQSKATVKFIHTNRFLDYSLVLTKLGCLIRLHIIFITPENTLAQSQFTSLSLHLGASEGMKTEWPCSASQGIRMQLFYV